MFIGRAAVLGFMAKKKKYSKLKKEKEEPPKK